MTRYRKKGNSMPITDKEKKIFIGLESFVSISLLALIVSFSVYVTEISSATKSNASEIDRQEQRYQKNVVEINKRLENLEKYQLQISSSIGEIKGMLKK